MPSLGTHKKNFRHQLTGALMILIDCLRLQLGSSNRFRPRLRARAQSTSEDGGAGDTQRLPLQLELVGFGQGDALEAALAQTREQGGEHLAGEEQPGWLRSRRSGGGGEARGHASGRARYDQRTCRLFSR